VVSYKVRLKFKSPLRATKPLEQVNLVQKHIEAVKGRILDHLRSVKSVESEEKLEKEVDKWLEGLLNVFPRKIYKCNGAEVVQIAFPASWILGVLEERAAILKIKGINRGLIKNAVAVKPYLIGLVKPIGKKHARPVMIGDIVFQDDTIVSADRFGKRSALKRFETLFPPLETQNFYIEVYTQAVKYEDLKKLLEFGRLGASRGQGFGSFTGTISKVGEGDGRKQPEELEPA
jgi:hypothetical protein